MHTGLEKIGFHKVGVPAIYHNGIRNHGSSHIIGYIDLNWGKKDTLVPHYTDTVNAPKVADCT